MGVRRRAASQAWMVVEPVRLGHDVGDEGKPTVVGAAPLDDDARPWAGALRWALDPAVPPARRRLFDLAGGGP